jgi:hypothetical protein
MIAPVAQRVFQVVVFGGTAFMVLGGGFFREETLPYNASRTVT